MGGTQSKRSKILNSHLFYFADITKEEKKLLKRVDLLRPIPAAISNLFGQGGAPVFWPAQGFHKSSPSPQENLDFVPFIQALQLFHKMSE